MYIIHMYNVHYLCLIIYNYIITYIAVIIYKNIHKCICRLFLESIHFSGVMCALPLPLWVLRAIVSFWSNLQKVI